MDADGTIEQAIETIARLHERYMLSPSHLHLAACGGCGGPSFQQPCPLCGFYPMGADQGRWYPHSATRHFFCEQVAATAAKGTGNIATWVLSACKTTVAYSQTTAFRQRLDAALAEAALLLMPDPGIVHDRISVDGASYGRSAGTCELWRFWEAARLLREESGKHPRSDGTGPDPLPSALADAIEDLHEGRLESACGILLAAGREHLSHGHSDSAAIRRALAELEGLASARLVEVPTAGPRP